MLNLTTSDSCSVCVFVSLQQVCVCFSPCSSLIRDFQAVQVWLRPAAASILHLVDVGGQEGPRGVAGRGMPLFVMLWVSLIGYMVGVFQATILVGDCRSRCAAWWFCITENLHAQKASCTNIVHAVPGGPGAARDGMLWCVLDVLERLWVKLFLVGPDQV